MWTIGVLAKTGVTMKVRRLIAGALVALITFSGFAVYPAAKAYTSTGVVSNNIHDHEYVNSTSVSHSYMIANPDGTISRLEDFGDIFLLETYNSSFKCLSQNFIKYEGSLFGGFYSGANYNYMIFGDRNDQQKSDVCVIKIVRYTKTWQRVSECKVYNVNTTVPFAGSNTAFCEYGNLLYIRCGHQTYKDARGMTYQASMTLCYNNASNTVADVQSSIKGNAYGTTANSGAQFMDVRDGHLGVCEASLTAPYGVLFSRYNNAIGNNTLQGNVASINTLGAAGALTSSIPAYSIGGYTITPQFYMAVGASQTMDGTSSNMNIFVTTIPLSSFSSSKARTAYLTGYAQGSPYSVGTPYLVKINDNKYAILYELRNGYSDTFKVYYMFIDASGNRLGDVASIDGCLSDCQPIVYAGNIVWYTTDGSSVKIYTIPVQGTTNNTGVYNNPAAAVSGMDYSRVFDFTYYCNKYPEIRVLYANDPQGAFSHFVNYGMAERRQASSMFNLEIYMYNYPDLVAAFGNNYKLYYQHYMTSGYAEGRNAATKIH